MSFQEGTINREAEALLFRLFSPYIARHAFPSVLPDVCLDSNNKQCHYVALTKLF